MSARGSATRDWDANTYDRVSDPQVQMALDVLERLDLRGDETVLDAGCGSGRVTRMLLDRLPDGRVIAVDGSARWSAKARAALPDRVEVFQSDLAELELAAPVDAVFSNAVFHWIADHDALFARLRAALKPGGGWSSSAAARGTSRRSWRCWTRSAAACPTRRTWPAATRRGTTPSPEQTDARLRAAGFAEVRCWRTDVQVTPEDPRAYTHNVVPVGAGVLGRDLDVGAPAACLGEPGCAQPRVGLLRRRRSSTARPAGQVLRVGRAAPTSASSAVKARDVALAAALRREAPARPQGRVQAREQRVVVGDPVEDRVREDASTGSRQLELGEVLVEDRRPRSPAAPRAPSRPSPASRRRRSRGPSGSARAASGDAARAAAGVEHGLVAAQVEALEDVAGPSRPAGSETRS